jgi:SAM-dependent methyltransferase
MNTVTGVNSQATSDDFEFAALNEAKNYRRILTEEFSPYLKGNVLEVGAGIGQMTREFAGVPGVETMDAIEPDPRFYAVLQRQGLKARCLPGTVSDLDPADLYDAIISINVLEHIEKHFEELLGFRNHLKPGGRVCLFVPACPSIYAPIDRTFGHFRRYNRAQLRDLLERAGFKILRLDYFNSLGFFAWWFNFCILKQMVFEKSKVRFYDRCLFPAVHALEKTIVRPPFGQSLLAVAEFEGNPDSADDPGGDGSR